MSDFDLKKRLTENGWLGRIVSVEHLSELKATIEKARSEAHLAEEFCKIGLDFFEFEPPADMPQASMVIIVAVPAPVTRVYFHAKGQRISLNIPPIYVDYFGRSQLVQNNLNSWLAQTGHRAAKAKLPLKTLAVRSGLARYGRNNVCFVPGMGSYLQLVGLYSDLPCVDDSWQEPQPLERCDHCKACLNSCPTGAILPDRFLIQADRCLTFFNEGSEPFPNWINPAAHNTLIGCLRCQEICPENLAVRNWIEEGGEFNEEETVLLSAETPLADLPQATADKVKNLKIYGDEHLGRNLAAIIRRQG